MRSEIRTETQVVTKIVWIAEDGKTFDNRELCEAYECWERICQKRKNMKKLLDKH